MNYNNSSCVISVSHIWYSRTNWSDGCELNLYKDKYRWKEDGVLFSDFPITEVQDEETEQAIADLEEIIRRDELKYDQPHADYGMLSYEL